MNYVHPNNNLEFQPRPAELDDLNQSELATCLLVLAAIAESGELKDLDLFEWGLKQHQKRQVWNAVPDEIRKKIHKLRQQASVPLGSIEVRGAA